MYTYVDIDVDIRYIYYIFKRLLGVWHYVYIRAILQNLAVSAALAPAGEADAPHQGTGSRCACRDQKARLILRVCPSFDVLNDEMGSNFSKGMLRLEPCHGMI